LRSYIDLLKNGTVVDRSLVTSQGMHQCCADIEIWWSDPIRKISVVSESDPDPKSMFKT